jgi:hypothetical protein
MIKPAHCGLAGSVLALTMSFGIPAYAQQTIERGAIQEQAQPATKPAKAVTGKSGKSTAATADRRALQTRPWTIDDAMPSRPRRYEPGIDSSPGLGRVPVQGGTFGFSTDQQVDPYKTPDGNRIRGLESTSKSDPSYFGLSLSVKPEEKGFLPRTILPDW